MTNFGVIDTPGMKQSLKERRSYGKSNNNGNDDEHGNESNPVAKVGTAESFC
jgi:hypothetical protein